MQYAAANHGSGVYRLTGRRNKKPFKRTISVDQFNAPKYAGQWLENRNNPNKGADVTVAAPVNTFGAGAVPINDGELRDFLITSVMGRLDDIREAITTLEENYSGAEPEKKEDSLALFGQLANIMASFRGGGGMPSEPSNTPPPQDGGFGDLADGDFARFANGT